MKSVAADGIIINLECQYITVVGQSVNGVGFFMKILGVLICLFLNASFAQAQFQYVFDTSIPVSENAALYPEAWNGGLNAGQYNSMDVNLDGKDDIVIFDRTAQKLITYLQVDGKYQYAPEFETLFPPAIYNWVLIRDFNCDGRKDLFTGHIFGISVYQNVSTTTDLKWELFPFYEGISVSEVVLTEGLSGRINLQIEFDDLPAISDADGDGDVDIFVMNYGGSGTIQYHRNFSVEMFGTCDSLAFELADPWWGGVRECHCDEFAFDKEECHSGGRPDHAGGKSLMLLDGDGDGFQDLLIAEGECGILNMLDNNGPVDAPLVDDAPHYPLNIAQEFSLYPTAYSEDLDFDGVRDIIIAPNIYSKGTYDMNLSQSAWFYRNTGSDISPNLVLQTKAFLQETMIDVGDNAVPAFADMDGDGDYDMFISNNELPSTIKVYRNSGTFFEPKFEFLDQDYLDLSIREFTQMKIQFVDINSDGRTDLTFMATDSKVGITDVFYILNKTQWKLDFEGQNIQRLEFQIARGENVSLIHVDTDGKADLLLGKSNGAVEYWRNTGGLKFSLEVNEYLGLSPNIERTRSSFTTGDLDADGKDDLVSGDETGRIRIVSDFRNAQDFSGSINDVVINARTTELYSPNLGGRIWPTTVNLYGTTKPLIVTGTTLGGVRVLRNTNDEAPGQLIVMYPNPVAAPVEVTIITTSDASLEIFSAKGQRIRPLIYLPEMEAVRLRVLDYAAGVYILRFSVANKTIIKRLVVH
jgi:hypothetical protein